MSANFDDTLAKALETAKSVLHKDILTSTDLFGALLHTEPYTDLYPELQKLFPLGEKLESPKSKVQTSSELKKILKSSMEDGVISAELIFSKLLHSEDLFSKGSPTQKRLLKESQQLHHLRSYQESEERTELLRSLSNYGRIISNTGKENNLCGREDLFPKMSRALMKMLRNDVLLIGPSGIGKSKIIQEFARRIAHCDPSIPRALHGSEVFQVSADLLSSGVVSRPQFQNRVQKLSQLLEQHPKLILVINPLDALINNDSRRTEQVLSEEAIRTLIDSDIPVIATLQPKTALVMDSKEVWEGLFEKCTVLEPSRDGIIQVITDLIPIFEEHYIGLSIDPLALPLIIDTAKELLPSQVEPRRSVQFFDDICVRAQTNNPPISNLTASKVEELLNKEDASGTGFASTDLAIRLNQQIIGQEQVLNRLASTITTRLSRWSNQDGPRGVFLFGGPTGVGKTETAVQLSC